jgi:uroporphyrinogen-III decarboxylase
MYKEVCDYVHKQGGFTIIHSCGFGESILDNWIEAGIDAWQTIERAALNDPARIREKVGNKIIMIGAVDASNTISFADTTEEVVEHTKNTIRDAVYTPEDACYIPGFTHDLLDCPVRNVRAAVDTMLQYGKISEIRKLKNQ